jgi:hypothetical protein
MKAHTFYPRTKTSQFTPIRSITITQLVLDFVEDEGLIPQYKGVDGKWHDFFYKNRSGWRSVVRFQTGEGLERFLQEVRSNWEERAK